MIYFRMLAQMLPEITKFPVVGIFGPRQSGKTTLVKELFSEYVYVDFEDEATRLFAEENPKSFLLQYENAKGIIFDEFQKVPKILSYIKMDVDTKDRPGYFVLTGSQNFLMNQHISESLAGRIGILTLLPLSIQELKNNNLLSNNIHDLIFTGGYPRLYSKEIKPLIFYPTYINSYVERDVRQLVTIENLSTFKKFLTLCAGRIGQLLNITDLAMNCNIDQKTVQRWLSILEASYVIFILQPHHENFLKRATKMPKIYFYDTGLACSLLRIMSTEEVALSAFKGPLFENLIIADLFKQYFSRGTMAPLNFWRDANGRVEVDCIIDLGIKLIPVEIKSGEVDVEKYFDGLSKWNEIAGMNPQEGYVVYGGEHVQKRDCGTLLGWQSSSDLVEKSNTK